MQQQNVRLDSAVPLLSVLVDPRPHQAQLTAADAGPSHRSRVPQHGEGPAPIEGPAHKGEERGEGGFVHGAAQLHEQPRQWSSAWRSQQLHRATMAERDGTEQHCGVSCCSGGRGRRVGPRQRYSEQHGSKGRQRTRHQRSGIAPADSVNSRGALRSGFAMSPVSGRLILFSAHLAVLILFCVRATASEEAVASASPVA